MNIRDKEQMSYLMCQTSASHTYGNITAFFQNMIIKNFPKDFFKTKHVSSKIAHRQLISTGKTFLKKTRPIFVLRPRIEWDKSDVFLHGSLLTNPSNMVYSSWGGTNLQPFIDDNIEKYSVKYLLNRDVINFDAIFMFSTMIDQINWAKNIEHVFQKQRPFDLHTCLESFIPEEMMELISECAGVPLKDENGKVSKFLKYINSVSKYPITYKLAGSSQTHEFYRYYPVTIDTIMTDMNVSEGSSNGQLTSGWNITCTFRTEFNTTGYYYIFSDNLKKTGLLQYNDGANIIPIFTDVIINEDLNLKDGWVMYASPTCRIDDSVEDIVDISSIINTSINEAIIIHEEEGLPYSMFIDFKIRKQGDLLPVNKYKVDLQKKTITFFNCNEYYTYKIIILINIEYLNQFIKDRFNLK